MSQYSVFDENIPVDQDNFAVAIMRKPEGTNPEHAFLMVEGRDKQGIGFLRRYDLLLDSESNENKALIYIKPEKKFHPQEAQHVFHNDFLKNEEVYSIAWSITCEQAFELNEDILIDMKSPPNYQVSGDQSIIAKSFSKEGHSCFSWAREKLHNLNDERIRLPGKYSDFIASKTSLHIKGGEQTKKNGGCTIF